MLKRSLSLILALVLVFTLAACGGGASSTADAGGAEPTTASEPAAQPSTAADSTEEPAQAADAPSGEAEYAVILITFSNQFYQDVQKGVEEEAEKLGITVDVYAANSEEDVTGQVSILENCISKGYKCIGVAPASADNLNNAIADAVSKGIYVVNLDDRVNLEGLQAMGGTVSAFVSTDNEEVGRMGAGYINDRLGGSGKVAIIEGKAGAAGSELRVAGAKEGFEAAGLELLDSLPGDWDRTKAYDITSNYLNKYDDLDAIYCANDTMAMGALEAVKAAGRDVIVVGTDGNQDALDSVAAGELDATIAQDAPKVGALGLQTMVDITTKGDPIDLEAEPPYTAIDPILVAKDA